MPWGALSITALLGAELAKGLAAAMLFTSGPVAMVMPLFCLAFVPGVAFKDILYALVAGLFWYPVSPSARIGLESCRTRAYCFLRIVFGFKRSFVKSTSPEILPYGC